MLVKGLIAGVERVRGPGKGPNPKPYDFYKVNFIDSESPHGSTQNMTLLNDGEVLAKLLPVFEQNRMKILAFHVFQNGQYFNFGSFVS